MYRTLRQARYKVRSLNIEREAPAPCFLVVRFEAGVAWADPQDLAGGCELMSPGQTHNTNACAPTRCPTMGGGTLTLTLTGDQLERAGETGLGQRRGTSEWRTQWDASVSHPGQSGERVWLAFAVGI